MLNIKTVLVCSLVFLLFLLSGCADSSPKGEDTKTETIEKVKLYYGDPNNEKMVAEVREISYKQGDDKYKIVLEELIKGPESEDLRSNISESTKVYGTIKQDLDLIINFSQEFLSFGGSVGEIIAVGSVVNTATQFKEINRVKILVEGEELFGPSGEARGFMDPFPEDPAKQEVTDAVLYFSNKNADKVVGEERTINGSPEEDKEGFIKRVLEELIDGPESGEVYPTIPKEVIVISVKINEDTALVDFSEEMHTKHWGGAAGESMTINSIVNTLTEFDFIKRVQITVN